MGEATHIEANRQKANISILDPLPSTAFFKMKSCHQNSLVRESILKVLLKFFFITFLGSALMVLT